MDIEKILKGREIVDAYRAYTAKPGAVDESHQLTGDIKALGFEKIQDFFDANEEACYIERTRCFELIGKCDACKGRVRACYPPNQCVTATKEYFKADKSFDIDQGNKDYREKVLNGEVTLLELKKISSHWHVWAKFPGNTPPTCTLGYKKLDDPRFDILWDMRAIDPVHYQQQRTVWPIEKVK
jgi:hypothetical protein